MEIQSHSIILERKAHYYSLGEANQQTKYFWIVTHGYGQLASMIIRKFDSIADDKHFILAPEGLSKFYWKRNPDQVGASWMTRQHRLDEIEDYCNYLNRLYDRYKIKMSENVKLILFGFSQGCATQYRWIMNNFPQYHYLIQWAGMTPEDLDYKPYHDFFKERKLIMYYGDEDEYLTEELKAFQINLAKKNLLDIEYIQFEGKHEISRSVLQSLKERIESESTES